MERTGKWKETVLLIFLACLILIKADEEVLSDSYKIEGKVFPPEVDSLPDDWMVKTKVLINGGDHLGFLKEDGSFTVNKVRSGSYVVEIISPDYMYEPARIDINSKGKIRARKVNFIQTSSVIQIPYPLKFKVRGNHKYFQIREQWRITDFLLNPMVLMMILPLVLIMLIPKMMNAADPETQREMQQSLNMPKYDMPELSEMMTSFFAGGKKPTAKTSKATKKKQ